MHGHIAVAAEHDHVFVLVVSIVAYRTLSIILSHYSAHVAANSSHFLLIQQYLPPFAPLFYLLEYALVLLVALRLLHLLYVLQEVLLQLGRLAHVKHDLVVVLLVPVGVRVVVLHETGFQLGLEGKGVGVRVVGAVGEEVGGSVRVEGEGVGVPKFLVLEAKVLAIGEFKLVYLALEQFKNNGVLFLCLKFLVILLTFPWRSIQLRQYLLGSFLESLLHSFLLHILQV